MLAHRARRRSGLTRTAERRTERRTNGVRDRAHEDRRTEGRIRHIDTMAIVKVTRTGYDR
ncbi:unnamed protein product [Streptomyces laurentii]|uniref:Uncharacterized protein n=1 Tax=Streptomyces laurentii TaxID=39478 RepID=A0A160NVL7_STRLU|nr:unnamed protein product [Streptomyces laurentii]